jgi:hypothetical protein
MCMGVRIASLTVDLTGSRKNEQGDKCVMDHIDGSSEGIPSACNTLQRGGWGDKNVLGATWCSRTPV